MRLLAAMSHHGLVTAAAPANVTTPPAAANPFVTVNVPRGAGTSTNGSFTHALNGNWLVKSPPIFTSESVFPPMMNKGACVVVGGSVVDDAGVVKGI